MSLYEILKNLINNNRFEKEDMIKKLNVFYAFNQITLEQYTELMHLVNPEADKKAETVIEEHKEEEHTEVTTQ